MSVRVQVLEQALQALRQAASRLRATHGDLTAHFPLTSARLNAMSQIDQERLDALAVRYARCQDLLAPAMRALARAQLEPKADASFLVLHALMQKQGIVATTADWERQRSLRNAVGHEYPEAETIADLLNGIQAEIPAILSMVERLSQVASALIAEHR
ncbi:hypothetical protein Thiowin_05051 [Thiorhodovibrio winogradskyi]|uniref:Nucleotidyltransferase substrate binding protein, HI0074 family n=1 Tax=Thiorhodovibrio winogradskyi TaxID=77007 RepID=A0ABZ0SJ81_9GAMM|nr:hypothetical protein [Thiorhodovibrio winogradskyi]